MKYLTWRERAAPIIARVISEVGTTELNPKFREGRSLRPGTGAAGYARTQPPTRQDFQPHQLLEYLDHCNDITHWIPYDKIPHPLNNV